MLRLPGQTGAGHSETESEWDNEGNSCNNSDGEDDEDSELDGLEGSELFEGIQQEQFRLLRDRIASNLHKNVNHQPVKPPRSQNPFTSEALAVFQHYFAKVQRRGLLPEGYGVCEEEWEEEGYPEEEEIIVGRRKRKFFIHLPKEIWLTRAETWAQGLYVMQRCIYENEGQTNV